jgi:hypothetical protein
VDLEIYDLEIDEWNETEMARHRVRPIEAVQVLDGEPVFLPNKKPHAASVVMIGPTHGGRLLTVPLAPTARPGVWRPATAWDASDGERARYRNAGGSR